MKSNMFSELVFEPTDSRKKKAKLSLQNGYSVEVYQHSGNTNSELPYEVQLFKNGEKSSNPDDNIGYLDERDVVSVIKEFSKMK